MGVQRVVPAANLAINTAEDIPRAPEGTGGMSKLKAPSRLAEVMRRSDEATVMVAARQVNTPDGAAAMWGAEMIGRRRPLVLAAVARRLDELTNMT